MSEQIEKNENNEATAPVDKMDKTAQMNNIIIDLKLKIDRLNYTLTALLDVNNITDTSKKIIDGNIVLITPTEHKALQDNLMLSINEINKIMIRVQNELNGDKK